MKALNSVNIIYIIYEQYSVNGIGSPFSTAGFDGPFRVDKRNKETFTCIKSHNTFTLFMFL
jgi:hypothetical protein